MDGEELAMKKKKWKSFVGSLIAAGAVFLLYGSLFSLSRVSDFLICGGLAVVIGWLVYQMGKGLDTSKKAPVQKKIPVTGIESVDQLIRSGQDMLAQIRDENNQIQDPDLSGKIDELETISNQIFLTVTDKPEKAPQIRRFMDYYLPTVLKMLTNYRKLDERGVTGENAEKTKKRVEEAMDIVLGAFRRQHDQLYQSDMLDVTTDISVLETLMKQDGLIDNVPRDSGENKPSAAGGH